MKAKNVLFFLLLIATTCLSSMSYAQHNERTFIAAKNENGKDKTFDEVVAQFKGKVIYVDFWASWCGPCMAEMPYSDKLHTKMHDKNIVFLYISLDSDDAAWQRGLKKMKNKGYHFLPSKAEMQNLSSKFNIASIPRYMIIDKKGKVVSSDAPRPSDEKTEYDLEKLLSKK